MKVRLSDDAKADLIDIFQYTLDKWGWRQADVYIDNLYLTFDQLESGEAHVRPVFEAKGYLRIKVGSHFIIFVANSYEYLVTRILHQSMDLVRHL